MRFLSLAQRNYREIIRDPLTLILGLGLPLFLLILFTLLGHSLPVPLFSVEQMTPGIMVFGFSFLTMFGALLLAQDRSRSLLLRLYSSPLKAHDYILAYALPLLPVALIQMVLTLLTALALGLPFQGGIFLSMLVLLPQILISLSLGLFLGSLFTEKQVQGLGNVYIILGSLMSGLWMDFRMIGGVWEQMAQALPFVHGVESARVLLTGQGSISLANHLIPWITAVLVTVAALLAFRRNLKPA